MYSGLFGVIKGRILKKVILEVFEEVVEGSEGWLSVM
jgi:hypothetical protein